jgi:quercetin dioxygenase-like cupin family protein
LRIESTDVNPSSALSDNAKDKSFWLLGDTVTFKVTGQQTDGKYSVWEIKVPSQSGPPSHYHTNLEEGFCVLEGDFSFQYNENVVNATDGSFIHIQRGIIHTYKNLSKNISRLLVTGLPAGFENFIEQLGVPITDEKNFKAPSTPPEIERIVEVAKKNAIIFVPDLKSNS